MKTVEPDALTSRLADLTAAKDAGVIKAYIVAYITDDDVVCASAGHGQLLQTLSQLSHANVLTQVLPDKFGDIITREATEAAAAGFLERLRAGVEADAEELPSPASSRNVQ